MRLLFVRSQELGIQHMFTLLHLLRHEVPLVAHCVVLQSVGENLEKL